MSAIFCKYCGKEITGAQISCWPKTGYCCRECFYTKHTEALKKIYEKPDKKKE